MGCVVGSSWGRLPVAVVRSMPYPEPALAVVEVIVIGAARVPSAISVPATVSSPRAVFSPANIRSELPWNRSVAPGWIVSVMPGPTVRSPRTVYGEPAAVSVVSVHSVPTRPVVATVS